MNPIKFKLHFKVHPVSKVPCANVSKRQQETFEFYIASQVCLICFSRSKKDLTWAKSENLAGVFSSQETAHVHLMAGLQDVKGLLQAEGNGSGMSG